MKPLESVPIFLEPRLRLHRRVPVVETLEFVRRFKDDDHAHPRIKYFVAKMTGKVNLFFSKDIFQLSILKWHLWTGEYKVTVRSRTMLRDRLCSTYTDGIEYRTVADNLRGIEIKPILDLEPEIVKSQETAFEAQILSKQIGKETGIEVSVSDQKRSSQYFRQ